MKTTIDPAGRVVIPKPIRARLGLSGGDPLEIVERNGVIEISPATTPMVLEERDGDLVAVPQRGKLPELTDEEVRDTLEQIRR